MRTIVRILCVILLIVVCLCIFQDSESYSVTDRVSISGVNHFITAEDEASGVKPTSGVFGTVTISHNSHEKSGVDCIVCHHRESNDARIKKCAFCHKGRPGSIVMHKLCVTCHMNNGKGVQKCAACHYETKDRAFRDEIVQMYSNSYKFSREDHTSHDRSGVACDVCHHPVSGIYTDKKNEKTARECSICHRGYEGGALMHSLCVGCHKKNMKGPVGCASCHKTAKAEVYNKLSDVIILEKTGHRLPQIQFTHRKHAEQYGTECVDCHHAGCMNKCSKCHQKKDVGKVVNLRDAYHQQCHDCHRRVAGPQGCKSCHLDQVIKKN